jgi:hypothetical protein
MIHNGSPRVHTFSVHVKMETEFIIALYLVISISFVWWVLSILSFFMKMETAEPPSDIFIFLVQIVDSVRRRHPHVSTESLVQLFRIIDFTNGFWTRKCMFITYWSCAWFSFCFLSLYVYQNMTWFVCDRCLEPISSQSLPSHHDTVQAMIKGAESRIEVQRAPER